MKKKINRCLLKGRCRPSTTTIARSCREILQRSSDYRMLTKLAQHSPRHLEPFSTINLVVRYTRRRDETRRNETRRDESSCYRWYLIEAIAFIASFAFSLFDKVITVNRLENAKKNSRSEEIVNTRINYENLARSEVNCRNIRVFSSNERTSLSTTRVTSYCSLVETSLAEGIRLVNSKENAYFSRAHFLSFYLSHMLIQNVR